MKILTSKIQPDPDQPRRRFDDAKLNELASSMTELGQLQPILVRSEGDGFVIVAGERRWRAAERVGWTEIDAEVVSRDTDEILWLQLAENLARTDLSPIEEARAYRALVAAGHSHREIGEKVGKSKSQVTQKLRLLDASPTLVELLDAGHLTEGHARILLTIKSMYDVTTTENTALQTVVRKNDDLIMDTEAWPLLWVGFCRPEDLPDGWIAMMGILLDAEHRQDGDQKARDLMVAAKALMEDSEIPVWWRPVAWWAMVAVVFDMSVVQLKKHLEMWRHRLDSARLFLALHPAIGDLPERSGPNAKVEQALDHGCYFGHKSDLRHAGIAAPTEANRADIFTELDALLESDRMALPSSWQPWAPKWREFEEKHGDHLADFGVAVTE